MSVDLEERKQRVMAATEELITQQGFDTVRLRDIAHLAGVSIGSIQHYFDTREALFLEAMSQSSWRRAAEWSHLGDEVADPAERLKVMLDGSIVDRKRCIAWMNMCSAATRHQDLIPLISRIYDAWSETLLNTLEEGTRSKQFTPTRPLDQILDTIMAMMDGLMVSAGLGINVFSQERAGMLLEDAVGQMLRYDFRPSESPEARQTPPQATKIQHPTRYVHR